MNLIKQRFEESIATKQAAMNDEALMKKVEEIANLGIAALRNGGKIIFCGNGGSAVDSMHLAAELSGRYYVDRPPLNAESLSSDNAFITAVVSILYIDNSWCLVSTKYYVIISTTKYYFMLCVAIRASLLGT